MEPNVKEKKPSIQVVETIWKGQIKDSLGRSITLRNPGLWDEYLICKTIGKDAESPQCMMMAELLIKVAMLDDVVMATPTSYREFAANLDKLGREGLEALITHASEAQKDKPGELEEIKK